MTKSSMTPDQIADCIQNALFRCMSFFAPGRHTADGEPRHYAEHREVAKAAEIDFRLLELVGSGGDASYRHSYEDAFTVGVEVEVNIGYRFDELRVSVQPRWSSFSGESAEEAIAAATLHLETAQKAARATCAARELMKPVMRCEKAQIKEGFAIFADRVSAAGTAFGTACKVREDLKKILAPKDGAAKVG